VKSSQPPAQCVSGGLSTRVRQSGRGADHSPPPRGEAKNDWGFISSPLACPHGVFSGDFTVWT